MMTAIVKREQPPATQTATQAHCPMLHPSLVPAPLYRMKKMSAGRTDDQI